MKAVCLLGSPRRDGSTAAIVAAIGEGLGAEIEFLCLHELDIHFCTGCRSCLRTGRCVIGDDAARVMEALLASELVLAASPSYWGDVTGQLKAFIDRCTPYGNPNGARLPYSTRAQGVAVAVRAGQRREESEQLVGTLEHFLGHLDIPLIARFTAEGIATREDLFRQPQVLERARALGRELRKTGW